MEFWKPPWIRVVPTLSLSATIPLTFYGMGRSICGAPSSYILNSTTAEMFLPTNSAHKAITDAVAKCLVALYGGD